MFRKLRLQLALVNLSVILVLFLILIIGTYYSVHTRMLNTSDHFLQKVAYDLQTGRLQHIPPELGFSASADKISEAAASGSMSWPPKGPRPHSSDGFRPPGDNDRSSIDPRPLPPSPQNEGQRPPLLTPPNDFMPGPALMFYAKLDSMGNITENSSFLPFAKEQLPDLITQARKLGQNKGSLIFADNEYHFVICNALNEPAAFILFQDFQRDRNHLRELITGLSFTGLICLVLSLFGSLFMANKAMIPIQESWQQQKNFLADASHELRTPLAVIQTNLELVRDNPQETVESQKPWLDNIYEETICMNKLVEALLFLARTDSHQQLLNKEEIQLDFAVSLATELFKPLAAAKNISLSLTVAETDVYCGDEAKIRQVISILLDNALRHTDSGGSIKVLLQTLPENFLITVSDTGEGIPAEHLGHIFQRFYQSDASRNKGGAGLGLAIAKWIVESHGGNISVHSVLGQGTSFSITLPRS